MQSWSLAKKMQVSQARIMEWYQAFDGKVYVSFSGGKDSTVLLDLVRNIYPEVPAVFVDTGLEFPEVREFVKTKENVVWLHPEVYDKQQRKYVRTSFKSVIEKYGYPVISKEQSKFIREYRNTKSQKLRDTRLNGNRWGLGKISNKHQHLITAPFKISEKCCDIMKKNPSKNYEKQTGNKPFLGTMAEESMLRKTKWLIHGCNAFDSVRPTSQPLSFWTEQDVLEYISVNHLPYASVYGNIVGERGGITQQVGNGQDVYGAGTEHTSKKNPIVFSSLKSHIRNCGVTV